MLNESSIVGWSVVIPNKTLHVDQKRPKGTGGLTYLLFDHFNLFLIKSIKPRSTDLSIN